MKWIAAHRILVRIILVCIGIAFLVLLIGGLAGADNHWYDYVEFVVWVSITINFGWAVPRTVEAWRRRRDQGLPS